ncbi:hypothetical protein PUV54_11895 [Hyphococcus flavus]|uniref:Uncharacterized protein n=1 Tax=Hyphococcus flavus TaxID=1866326 RepID=A0AAF0CFA0_9PROT|nr:hypothetical protein [Hyphococcus flavus]WDI30658.1 hypothetical protein PUV54_11895 [Hyphococcus flavus]
MAKWIAGFLALYAAHVSTFLMAARVDDPPFWTGILSLASLIALFGLVAAFIATRDEVKRAIALTAGAVAALATALLTYAAHAFAWMALPLEPWALSVGIFLIAYGALSWRARL